MTATLEQLRSVDQLRSVASDARQRLADLQADLRLAEAVRSDLLTDAVPDEVDDLIELDTAVTKAERKVELQTEIVQRAELAVAEAERAAAIDAAHDAERQALSDYLKVLLRAHAALTELNASRADLRIIAAHINDARRIIGRKERFVPTFIPQINPEVIRNIESAANNVYARVGATADERR